jgi:hypothetical protein
MTITSNDSCLELMGGLLARSDKSRKREVFGEGRSLPVFHVKHGVLTPGTSPVSRETRHTKNE